MANPKSPAGIALQQVIAEACLEDCDRLLSQARKHLASGAPVTETLRREVLTLERNRNKLAATLARLRGERHLRRIK